MNYYKRELAHVYGLEVLLKVSNLEKAGVLYTQSESRAYAVLRKVCKISKKKIYFILKLYFRLRRST